MRGAGPAIFAARTKSAGSRACEAVVRTGRTDAHRRPNHFVGTQGLCLITTPAGHTLLSGCMPSSTSGPWGCDWASIFACRRGFRLRCVGGSRRILVRKPHAIARQILILRRWFAAVEALPRTRPVRPCAIGLLWRSRQDDVEDLTVFAIHAGGNLAAGVTRVQGRPGGNDDEVIFRARFAPAHVRVVAI